MAERKTKPVRLSIVLVGSLKKLAARFPVSIGEYVAQVFEAAAAADLLPRPPRNGKKK